MKRTMKFLHTAGAIGLTGAAACYLLLLHGAPEPASLGEYAAVREAIARICRWLLLPSLLVVLVSGLLAMAVHRPFLDKRWAWAKAALGIVVFKATLAVQAPGERGAELSRRALAGELDPAALPELVRDEPNTLWVLLLLSLANVALAIWRPRLRSRRRTGPAAASERGAGDGSGRRVPLGETPGAS